MHGKEQKVIKCSFLLQIGAEGFLFPGSRRNLATISNLDMIVLSTSQYPTVITVPQAYTQQIQTQNMIILHYRVVNSESDLEELDLVVSNFNSNLQEFHSTLALIATWQIVGR